jgi:RNA polymerase sigma-70 factor (ECF subfamily)
VANETGKLLFLAPDDPTPVPGARLDERTDDELMLLARGGVADAFDGLVRRHQARVLRVASRYLGLRSAARDVGQETFFELYRALPRYQARGRFTGYLYRLLLNQCRRAVRARRATDPMPADLPSAAPLADEQVLDRERHREIQRAADGLSHKLREVLALRFGAELSYQEIADALDLPLGTVKRRLFDALERLRRDLEGA